MTFTDILQQENTLIVLRKQDLSEFATYLTELVKADRPECRSTDLGPEKPITQDQAVKDYNISRQTLYNFRKRGLIKGYSLGGGRIYYYPSEINAALKSEVR